MEESDEKRKEMFNFVSKATGLSLEELSLRTKQHPAAHTIEEWQPFATSLFPDAKMCKNLFLKDKKKGSLWLVVALFDTDLDMKKLTKELKFKSGNLRFAHEDVLLDTLGVKQGSVTPLALFNDIKEKKVNLVLDIRIFADDNQKLLFHPLSNDFTTTLTAKELKQFVDSCGHNCKVFDIQ